MRKEGNFLTAVVIFVSLGACDGRVTSPPSRPVPVAAPFSTRPTMERQDLANLVLVVENTAFYSEPGGVADKKLCDAPEDALGRIIKDEGGEWVEVNCQIDGQKTCLGWVKRTALSSKK
ncbi:MAG: hypothetical protein M1514_00560 [Patescibacteria group bacterium]|nr:hypothetical protein [Patescibacteria group bacterium]